METRKANGNYAAKGKLAITQIPVRGTADGRRAALNGVYEAVVQAVKPSTFKSGAFGVKVTYALTTQSEKGREISEHFVFQKNNGVVNQIGIDIFATRLSSLGLSSESILEFALPQDTDDFGDVGRLIGKKLNLTIDSTETYLGKPSAKVKASTPVGGEE